MNIFFYQHFFVDLHYINKLKTNTMENLTAKEVLKLSESIFFRLNFKGEWKVLTDFNGNTFEFISEAKAFVRENLCKLHVELASFEQALMNNGQWDNV